MVKRQTNFKQVYLVDALGLNYINNQNQNSISHNVSLSIPKTNDGSYYPIKPQTLQNSIEQNVLSKNKNVQQSKLDFDAFKNNEISKTKINGNLPPPEQKDLKTEHLESINTNNINTLEEQDDDTMSMPDSFSYHSDENDRSNYRDGPASNYHKSTNVYDKNLGRKKNNVFTCTFCNQQFNKKILLKKHMYYHVRNSNSNKQEDKNESNQIVHPQNADDDWIDVPDDDMNDRQNKVQNPQNITNDDNDIKKLTTYKCSICQEQFRNYESAKQHQLETHGVNGPLKRSLTNTKLKGVIGGERQLEELQSYWCSNCLRFFQNFESLQSHLKKAHSNAPLRAKRSKSSDKIKRSRVLYYSKY